MRVFGRILVVLLLLGTGAGAMCLIQPHNRLDYFDPPVYYHSEEDSLFIERLVDALWAAGDFVPTTISGTIYL
ncbi:hypothetical protein LJC45_05460 [Alistipes sp. OttesenSCG-928-B03]|nr:hypothetical protein [Alistipes sp. OttesenSCG-928-B03]